LKEQYPNHDTLVPGVCSLQTTANEHPWIVCPRRLLALGKRVSTERAYQKNLERALFNKLGYDEGMRIGIWREVKLKLKQDVEGVEKELDYTFDYILVPVRNVLLQDVQKGMLERRLRDNPDVCAQFLAAKGFRVFEVDSERYVQDYPVGAPAIVEIMTSSTSGGNKAKRTQVGQAFEDALKGLPHIAPSINYRQVWARMVSQLLVKSELARGWGGVCIWVVQDVLVDYISRTTGLTMSRMVSDVTDDVNVLSLSYGDLSRLDGSGVIDVPDVIFYAGKINPSALPDTEAPGFIDIVRTPFLPTSEKLMQLLVKDGPASSIAQL
jgi:hypothetical protein